MPYASQRDRTPHPLEIRQAPWPLAPLNLFLTSGYQPGVFDLRWDDPAQLAVNGNFVLTGVNLYRSFDGEYGPFWLVNELPIGSNFWRDQTDNVLVVDEDVTDQFVMGCPDQGSAGAGDGPRRYVFRVQHSPIVVPASQNVPTNDARDVQVFVDGVEATVLRVDGRSGTVELTGVPTPNVATQKLDHPAVPGLGSRVTCTYRYNRSFLRTDLAQRVFYRATAVGYPVDLDRPVMPEDLRETPLENAAPTSNREIEKLDYIWREAVRRNRWILAQGGERVKVFLRKNVGVQCPCIPRGGAIRRPTNDCPDCYGTGFVGGYEGPYDIIIAPDDAERRISQRDVGRTVEHTYEVWTGPSPLLNQRDFIAKINGDRYSVGPVRMPTNRGMVLQQHFNIGLLDELDIRYQVPVDNLAVLAANQIRKIGPERAAPAQITDKVNIPDERELRGRTITWENIVY